MSSIKQSIFWVAIYLTVVVILAQFDYQTTPIIDFAKYFYFVAVLVVPVTVFFPAIVRVSVFIPLAVWGCVYIALLQVLDRTTSAPSGSFAIVLLEFIMIEIGVWLSYQFAHGISHAESLMDALAVSAFPNDIKDVESQSERIKAEITRSRRYHRPLSIAIVESRFDDQLFTREMLKSVQRDLMNRFTTARIAQIIDDRIRQTDLLLKDSHGRFLILCPETDAEKISLLAKRIVQSVKERTQMQILWGIASFPNDALTFEDLIQVARNRMARSDNEVVDQVVATHPQ